MPPVVSVIIPVLDAARTLGECLDALATQTLRGEVEVVVVDNGSSDASRAIAERHSVVGRVIDQHRSGSYAARNAGIGGTTAPVLAFTDADCVPEPGWLAAGLQALEGAALVGGAILPVRTDRPTVWERYDRAMYLDQADLVRQGFAATANLFVHRDVIDTVGRFDAALRSSGDLEFCRRATEAGFDLAYAPDARVRHHPRATAVETWRLHRRIGAGWRRLADRGRRPAAWRDLALRIPLGTVVDRVGADGPTLRRRELAHVHVLATAARWVGWLTARP